MRETEDMEQIGSIVSRLVGRLRVAEE